MSSFKRAVPYVFLAALVSGCGGSSNNSLTPPALSPFAPTIDNPSPNLDPGSAPTTDPTNASAQDVGAGDEGCPVVYAVNLEVPATDGGSGWSGPGRLQANECMPAGTPYDAFFQLRVPEFNRCLRVKGHLDPASTENVRMYAGTRLVHHGNDSEGALINWSLHTTVTASSIAPLLRVEGRVERHRTRWFTNDQGDLVERTDTLNANFSGTPTTEQEPQGVPDL